MMLWKIIVRTSAIISTTTYILALSIISRLGIRKLYWSLFRPKSSYEPLRFAHLCRLYFEKLGPTFIKFGQIIASSPGLFSKELSDEFKKCLDQVPPFALAEAHQILDEEFEKPWSEVFAEIDPKPMAAASIAQVHTAKLHTGEEVVIKIQRPRIRTQIDGDIWWMKIQAWILERLIKRARLANLTGMISDFEATIYEELNFVEEAKNMNEFNSIMQKHAIDNVIAPRVYLDYTTPRILTMERFTGFKADDIEESNRLGLDSEYYLRVGMRAWLLTVVLHGSFHGDVHAGNLMFLPEQNKIGFLDFGITGRFDPTTRQQVIHYLLAFLVQDYEEVAKCMVDMGSAPADIDIDQFAAELKKVYAPLFSENIANINYGEFIPKITNYATRFGISLPREFMLILKQLLYFDRYAKLAAPNLNVFSDVYLIDYLFTPAAAEAGIDTQKLMTLLMKAQSQ